MGRVAPTDTQISDAAMRIALLVAATRGTALGSWTTTALLAVYAARSGNLHADF